MRKSVVAALATSSLLMAATSWAVADQQFGTAAEAKAMLEKAVAAVKADETAALEKFKKGEDGFKDRDLYVFCFDAESGKFTAHPNEKLVGTDVRTLKDKSGEAMGEKIYEAAKADVVSAVDYVFPKPGTTEAVPKQSFVTKVKDQGCGVGYYK